MNFLNSQQAQHHQIHLVVALVHKIATSRVDLLGADQNRPQMAQPTLNKAAHQGDSRKAHQLQVYLVVVLNKAAHLGDSGEAAPDRAYLVALALLTSRVLAQPRFPAHPWVRPRTKIIPSRHLF